jgi:hypothetical protein
LGTATGGLNQSHRLTTTTVIDDGAADTLTGELGLDWFWLRDLVDSVTDLNTGGSETRSLL